MISLEILCFTFILLTLGLSSVSSTPATCFISAPFVGQWIQPGLVDVITINETWYSLKGTCLATSTDMKNKFLFYNEQTRCKRCILFISRHENALQYRESECFDADDDDNGRICASITPDTVLYTLFRDNAQSISCPLKQSWTFEQHRLHISSSSCQPKAFHHCSSTDTFQLSYNNRCSTNRDVQATCIASFTDGNTNYVVARSVDRLRFVCFSYTKTKRDEQHLPPHEVYLSADETCRDLLTKESTIALNVLPGQYHRQDQTNLDLPQWTQGTWLSIGTSQMNTQTVLINHTQLMIKRNLDHSILHDLRFTRIISFKRSQNTIRLEAKTFEQCSSISYCIKLSYRASSVIDLSIGLGSHGCRNSHLHHTLYKPSFTSNISCPQMGFYKSSLSYRPSIPVSSCSTGLWTLAIGCETNNRSEINFSSTCRHESVPDVQVITSIKGHCVASWRTDQEFQRTLILYEQSRAFCLIQPLKSSIASWIFSGSSCTNVDSSLITVENSLRYSDTCERSAKAYRFSSNNFSPTRRVSYLLNSFLLVVAVVLCKY